MISDIDKQHLRRCIELAKYALTLGDEPFGSVLVSDKGKVLFEDHNRVANGDHTRHPEFEIARWAAANLSLEERRNSTVYTSGEHCPMCAAAHGWVGLGRIVYASSSKQLTDWLDEFCVSKSQVKPLPIDEILNDVLTEGPVEEFENEIRNLHAIRHTNSIK